MAEPDDVDAAQARHRARMLRVPAQQQQTLDQIVDSATRALGTIASMLTEPDEKATEALSEARRALETFYTNATYATLLAAQQAKTAREVALEATT